MEHKNRAHKLLLTYLEKKTLDSKIMLLLKHKPSDSLRQHFTTELAAAKTLSEYKVKRQLDEAYKTV